MTKHILIADILSEAGSSAAKALANKGWQITGISACGGEGVDYVCNLMNRSEVMALVGRIEAEKGDVFGLLVSTAFQLPGVPFLDAAPDIWQARLDAWLRYATNICYACGRKMVARQEGRIMVITPDFNRIKGDCVVEATAAGSLHGFLKSFGAEVAAARVCVNGIYAGLPFDFEAINATCDYLLAEGQYVSAQLIALSAEE